MAKSTVIRASPEFVEYSKCIQRLIVTREHKVPSLTEVTKRIANESVHPYEDVKHGFKKIGKWKVL